MCLRVHQLHHQRVSEKWGCVLLLLCRTQLSCYRLTCKYSIWADCPSLSRASDKCQREKRKTINGDDLVWAMSILGFEEYGEPLKLYLYKYREVC